MARKYDRYGLNRQYKAKPCSKRYPFPYPLPFVDDFSAGNVLEKATVTTPSGPGSHRVFPDTGKTKKDRVIEDHTRRRAINAKRKLEYSSQLTYKKGKHTGRDTVTEMMAGSAAFALVAPLAAEVAGDIAVLRYGAIAARRMAKQRRFKVRGKIVDGLGRIVGFAKKVPRRAKKVKTLITSQKPRHRFIRQVIATTWKKFV